VLQLLQKAKQQRSEQQRTRFFIFVSPYLGLLSKRDDAAALYASDGQIYCAVEHTPEPVVLFAHLTGIIEISNENLTPVSVQ
jgi:hypothetical protein